MGKEEVQHHVYSCLLLLELARVGLLWVWIVEDQTGVLFLCKEGAPTQSEPEFCLCSFGSELICSEELRGRQSRPF